MTLAPLPGTTATCDGCGYFEASVDVEDFAARWRILVEPDGVREFHTLACLTTWVRRAYMDGAATAQEDVGVRGSASAPSCGAAEPVSFAGDVALGGSNEHQGPAANEALAEGAAATARTEATS